MRGKGLLQVFIPEPLRITPACAGKSTTAGRGRMPSQDHPRVCGEKYHSRAWKDAVSGSPPRVRGKDEQVPQFGIGHGITPACAGKRGRPHSGPGTTRDHPRVCGEKSMMSRVVFCTVGSPPRVRGKAQALLIAVIYSGITPACAGKSLLAAPVAGLPRDHPRVCGEKWQNRVNQLLVRGSPPRMRGKVIFQAVAALVVGITPAYAGKRNTLTALESTSGEKLLAQLRTGSIEGSPPRVRGKAVPPRSAAASGCRGPSVPEYDAGHGGARRQAGPPGPAPPPQMRLGWSPPPCTGRQCRTRKSTHARRARIPAPAHTPAPQ